MSPSAQGSGKRHISSLSLLASPKEGEHTSEPASSKDTATLDHRSHSPRNSKSVGTVSQGKIRLDLGGRSKGSDAEDVSLSSLSGLEKAGERASAGACTPRARAESDVSNHSRLRHSVEDLHEADSHSALRGVEAGPGPVAAATCSGSNDARDREAGQEEIDSRCPSEERNAASPREMEAEPMEWSHSPPAAIICPPHAVQQQLPPGGKKRQRDPDLDEDATAACDHTVKVEVGSESPEHHSPRTLPSVFTTDAAARASKVARRGSQRDEDAFSSRACSATPQDEDGEEEAPATPRRPLRKQPKGKASRKASAGLIQRRSTRVAALDSQADCAELDEDYLPPGEAAEAFAVSAAAPKVARSTRTRSSSLPKPCIASSSAALAGSGSGSATRSNSNRLRWGSGPGFSMGAPLTSPLGSRRLRSQPLDVSSLVPDAFSFEPPPAKRAKHSALLSGMHGLQQLEQKCAASSQLAKSSKSGICKPYPAWREVPGQAVLAAKVEAELKLMREAQRSDFKQLDGQPNRPEAELEALADRLGPVPMRKALLASAKAEANEKAQSTTDDETDSVFKKACRALMPSAMRSVCEGWSQRLDSPCIGVLGEPTTCLKARRDRDLQNIWDDLLSRHTLETHVLESLSSWLSPAVRVEKEE